MPFDVAALKPPPLPAEERDAAAVAARPNDAAPSSSEAGRSELAARVLAGGRRVRTAAAAGFALPAIAGMSAAWVLPGLTGGALLGGLLALTASVAAVAAARLVAPTQHATADERGSYQLDGWVVLLQVTAMVVAVTLVVVVLHAPSLTGLLAAGFAVGVAAAAWRGLRGVAQLQARTTLYAALCRPWPAAQSMEEALARRAEVADAAHAALGARHHTARLVERKLRPWSLLALPAPVIALLLGPLGGPQGGAMFWTVAGILLAANLAACAAAAWGLRRKERPSRGLATAAAALALGLAWLPLAAQPGAFSGVALLFAVQATLAGGVVLLALRAHAFVVEQEPPLPGLAHLVDTLAHRDPEVRHTAHLALRFLTGIDLPPRPTAWRDWLQDGLERTGKLPRPNRAVSIHEVPLHG